MKRRKSQSQSGFTLVETLVAIFIFISSVTALIVVTGQSVSDVSIAKNKLTARALSEEGIEMIRNMRDSSWLSEANPGEGWADFVTLVQPCFSAGGCIIINPHDFYESGAVSSAPNIQKCISTGQTVGYPSDCALLDRDDLGDGYYDYASSTNATPFQRTITLSSVGSGDSIIKVSSVVAWRQGSTVKTLSASEYIYDWR